MQCIFYRKKNEKSKYTKNLYWYMSDEDKQKISMEKIQTKICPRKTDKKRIHEKILERVKKWSNSMF